MKAPANDAGMLMISSFVCLVLTSPGFAATYYVDSAAPPGGDGQSWPTAWQHPGQITGVGGGDICRISGGAYIFGSSWDVPNGTPEAQLIITYSDEAGHNGKVIFTAVGAFAVLRGLDYVTFDFRSRRLRLDGNPSSGLAVYDDSGSVGFRLLGAELARAIRMYDSRKTEIGWCEFEENPGCDTYVLGVGRSDFSGWGNNSIHDNVFRLVYIHGVNAMGGNGDDGIKWTGSCDIYNNRFVSRLVESYPKGQHQDGIQTDGVFLRTFNNYFENITGYSIYHEFTYLTFSECQIFNNVFNVWDPVLRGQPNVAAVAIFNKVTNGGQGIYKNIQLFNNTAQGHFRGFVITDSANEVIDGCHFVNNIALDCKGGTFHFVATTRINGTDISHNLSSPQGVAFLSPGQGGNYRLGATATACIDQGTNAFVGGITDKDKDGVIRMGNWDIGAYELGGTMPVPAPTATPVVTPTPVPVPTVTPTPTPTVEGTWPVSGTVIKTQSGFRIDLVIEPTP
jgi:hypothetical protein